MMKRAAELAFENSPERVPPTRFQRTDAYLGHPHRDVSKEPLPSQRTREGRHPLLVC